MGYPTIASLPRPPAFLARAVFPHALSPFTHVRNPSRDEAKSVRNEIAKDTLSSSSNWIKWRVLWRGAVHWKRTAPRLLVAPHPASVRQVETAWGQGASAGGESTIGLIGVGRSPAPPPPPHPDECVAGAVGRPLKWRALAEY
jgi:hypothetical protein